MTHIVFLFKFKFIGVNPIRLSIIYTFTYRHASKVHKFFLDAWLSNMRDEIEIIDVCCHAKEIKKRERQKKACMCPKLDARCERKRNNRKNKKKKKSD